MFTTQYTQNDGGRAVAMAMLPRALQVARATFSVAPGQAPLLFKIDSAASVLTTFKRCANL